MNVGVRTTSRLLPVSNQYSLPIVTWGSQRLQTVAFRMTAKGSKRRPPRARITRHMVAELRPAHTTDNDEMHACKTTAVVHAVGAGHSVVTAGRVL